MSRDLEQEFSKYNFWPDTYEELAKFITAKKNYIADNNIHNKATLNSAFFPLFCSLKNYKVSGVISPTTFENLICMLNEGL